MKMKFKVRGKAISVLLVLSILFALFANFAGATNKNSETNSQFTRLECDHIEELEDGGKIYVYNINGVINKFPVPPAGFDPLSATDEQLSTYGFPPRPVTRDAATYTSWLSLVEDYESTDEPVIELMDRPVSSLQRETSQTMTRAVKESADYVWSGYVSNLGINPTKVYTQAQVNYTQPKINAITGSASSNKVAYWVGLGGDNEINGVQRLVQAGTATTGLANHWAWYEYLSTDNPVAAVEIKSLAINANDSIHIYISFQKANNKFSYYIANNTTGKSASGIVELDADEYFDGTSAEWIVERGDMIFPNFGSITMSSCQATYNTSNTWNNLGNLSGLDRVTMTNTGELGGTVACAISNISNSNKFTATWKSFG